ncbi:MAG: T9SS C-terminal target domain-containing protein [Bacteroidetes bacterium]|nr:MAG: T9SS C-terminal target domain-containing protein [Bacteroidota bacterium]
MKSLQFKLYRYIFFAAIILSWQLVLHAQTLSINEFMASNSSTISDEDGDFEDWIELYNYGDDPVYLEGWGLSDDFSNPFRWVFPDIAIGPGEYLLVWASGKDRKQGVLHTNFSIDASGEELLLVHPSGNWVDVVNPIAVPTDISYGRKPDGTGDWFYFDEPTPGLPNVTEGFYGILPPPEFSHHGGFYEESFNLILTHSDPEAIIIYTTDGSNPTTANLSGKTYFYKNQYAFYPDSEDGELLVNQFMSNVYSSPIEIVDRTPFEDKLTHKATTVQTPNYFPEEPVFKGTVIGAKAYREGMLPSQTASHTFFISQQGRSRIPLPVVSIAIQENYFFDYEKGIYTPGIDADDWRVSFPDQPFSWPFPGNFHRRGIDYEYFGNMEFIPEDESFSVLNQGLGIRIHGGGTRSFPMKSLRLYARGVYGENTFGYPFFKGSEYDEFKRLILRNGGQDFLTTHWGQGENPQTMFRDAMSQRLVNHLHFDIQLYEPVIVFINGEYWGLHNIRERYDKHYLERVYGLHSDSIDLLTMRNDPIEGDNVHYNQTLDFIEENSLSDDQNYQYILTRIDEKSFMDYQIANIYLRNTDWPGNNIDYWRKRTEQFTPDAPYGHDGRWRWLLYDTDFGFGLVGEPKSYKHNTLEFATAVGLQNWPNPDWSTFMLRSFLENEQFKHKFIIRFADLLNTCFHHQYVLQTIEEMKSTITPAMEEHFQRWSNWENLETWDAKVNVMREFAINRHNYIREHLTDFFELDSKVVINANVSHPYHGHIKVNSIEIHGDTPGVDVNPFPWRGYYFKGVPIELVALPAKGYRFSHWDGDYASNDSILSVNPEGDFSVTAHFVTTGEELLVYYWLLDNQLANDMPLEEIQPHYSIAGGAKIDFISCMPDYPYYEGHQYWRMGSMERRNEPTPLNYRPAGNNDLPYNESAMRAIQIKQPLAFGDNVSSLLLHLPTPDIKDPILRFAVKDEGAAKGLLIDYSTTEEISWQSLRNSNTIPLTDQYQLVELDLSNVEATYDNPHLKVRIRFISDNPWAQNEKRVIFNNITLDGVVCMAYTLKSLAEDNGQIFPSGIMNISCCSRKEFLVVPNANHIIENVWLDGVSILDDVEIIDNFYGTYLFESPYKNHELRASFAYAPWLFGDNNSVVVYPNPASDALFVASENEINLIQLHDLSGRLLYEYDCTCNNHKLNLFNFNTGIYLVRIFTVKEIFTRKVQVLRPAF